MKHVFCVVCIMMVLALGSLSHAGDMGADPACKADAAKFCADKTYGKGLIMCMHENKDKFSQACQDKMKEMKAKMHEGHEACATDVDKFCADKKGKGPREVISCLKTHEAELSASCKEHAAHGPHGPGHGAMMMGPGHDGMAPPQAAPPAGSPPAAAGK